MENLRVLSGHIRLRSASGNTTAPTLRLPGILPARDGRDFVNDDEGGFWRAQEFIENTRTLDSLSDMAQAGEIGFALGRFHALIHDLDPARLHRTLPAALLPAVAAAWACGLAPALLAAGLDTDPAHEPAETA